MPAAIPDDERERLAALHECEVLDTAPELAYTEIAELARQICNTPIALVSLVDAERQWFKARVGLAAEQTSRASSFCAHTLVSRQPLIVHDTHADARFADNPLVTGDPRIRFYAGVPLVLDDGRILGTLCVIDRVARSLSGPQFDALAMLARQVSVELDLRRRSRRGRGEGVQVEAPISRRIGEGMFIAQRYRLGRLLGAGGMGVVFEAEDALLGGPVAVKFLLRERCTDHAALERFVGEAQALLRIADEHVARILDVGNLRDGAPFIVMERLDGEDLGVYLAARGLLPVHEALDLLLRACVAVGRAHACGIIHCDLKPGNLFLTRDEGAGRRLKVLDFGAALLRSRDPRDDLERTSGAVMFGSIHYMAPEQMLNIPDLDGRADIWSLGVILYELLTGALPFAGHTVAEVCSKMLQTQRVAVRQRQPAVSFPLDAIVARCLCDDREQRFADVGELQAALLGCRDAGR